MRSENIFDRFGYWARPVLIALLWLCLPVALVTYSQMAGMIIQQWPWWVSLPAITAHLVCFLGIASLFDRQEERRNPPEADPAEPPPRS